MRSLNDNVLCNPTTPYRDFKDVKAYGWTYQQKPNLRKSNSLIQCQIKQLGSEMQVTIHCDPLNPTAHLPMLYDTFLIRFGFTLHLGFAVLNFYSKAYEETLYLSLLFTPNVP